MNEEEQDLKNFNKDLAVLYEISRLETNANNFLINKQHEERFLTLKGWKFIISPICSKEEQEQLNTLIKNAKGIPWHNSIKFDEDNLDTLHQSLNHYNYIKKLQFTKSPKMSEALFK